MPDEHPMLFDRRWWFIVVPSMVMGLTISSIVSYNAYKSVWLTVFSTGSAAIIVGTIFVLMAWWGNRPEKDS